jgi:Ser/Thr protein kinase RdoA (MazF antagonist)
VTDSSPLELRERDLVEVLEADARRYDGELDVVERLIHGSDDATVIARQLSAFLREHTGVGIRGGLFHHASVGSVTGVVLDDDRTLVIKAYQPRWARAFLDSVVETQRALASAGLPCATPVLAPQRYGDTWATVETYLADPGQPVAFGPAEMTASAHGLAAVIGAAPMRPALAHHPMHAPHVGLYPTPHSPLFDFDATQAGAEWIDDLARAAAPYSAVGRRVVAHTDWAARNVRLAPAGVRAIYDLDSVAIVPLPAALGTAAATWRATGDPGDGAAPGVDEIDGWLGGYPDRLSIEERRAVFAHALSVLAYSARCEHAIDPHELRHRRARPTLRTDGRAFLERLR